MGTIGGGYFAGLLAEKHGWRLSFVVFGGLGILLGFVPNRFLVEPPRGASERPAPGADVADSPDLRSPTSDLRSPTSDQRLSLAGFLHLVRRTPTLLCLLGAFM